MERFTEPLAQSSSKNAANSEAARRGKRELQREYRLPAKYVVHTVGPVWRGGRSGEDELLHNCYEKPLKLAEQNGVKTIAFPSTTTGAYRFPIERSARIAVNTVRESLEKMNAFEKVIFVCFSQADYEVYKKAMDSK